MNKIYNDMFLQAKSNYIKLGIQKEEVDLCVFNPTEQGLTNEAYADIQWCNNYIFEQFDFSNQIGLCSYLCSLGALAYNLASQINISFITVGKVLYNDKNIFKVAKQDKVIEQLIEEHRNFQEIKLGAKLHVWITLDNGLILDPSINHTINNDTMALVESPSDMQRKHNLVYKPYIVTGIDDSTRVHELIKPLMKKEAYRRQIDDKYSKYYYPGMTKR